MYIQEDQEAAMAADLVGSQPTGTPTPQAKDDDKAAQADMSTETKDDGQVPEASASLPAAPDVLPQVRPWNRANRNPEFTIFVDEAAVDPGTAATITPREDGRRMLGLLRPNAINRTGPPRRCPSTPFPFNIFDPNWENTENYASIFDYSSDTSEFTFSSPTSPPFAGGAMPRTFVSSPTVAATPTTPATPLSPPTPLTTLDRLASLNPRSITGTYSQRNVNVNPRLSARHSLRPRPRNIVPIGSPVEAPRSMELYKLLGLKDWTANVSEIKAAYKQAAMKAHPDKFDEENREMASRRMARINAAKDVLINADARKKYHEDGKVPWKV